MRRRPIVVQTSEMLLWLQIVSSLRAIKMVTKGLVLTSWARFANQ